MPVGRNGAANGQVEGDFLNPAVRPIAVGASRNFALRVHVLQKVREMALAVNGNSGMMRHEECKARRQARQWREGERRACCCPKYTGFP